MGDRCWLSFTLRGELTNLRHLVRLADGVINEGLMDQVEGTDRRAVVNAIVAAWLDGSSPEFVDEECNYANIDDMEKLCQELGMAYHISHSDGGEYAGANKSWMPGYASVMEVTDCKGINVVETGVLRRVLALGDPVKIKTELESLMDAVSKAEGYELGEFRVSGKAEKWFARQAAAHALLKRSA
jgi:hypothetical protein